MAAVMVLMAAWWIQDVVPIPVTSLLPIFLFPLFGLQDVNEVSVFYGRPIIFLFLGGFLLALGLQESGVHKRLALKIVSLIGSKPRQLIFGFMIVAGFLSMWISNTASVMVMLPIGLSVIQNVKKEIGPGPVLQNFGVCFMLGIAYASNIGGMATLIGTPPNLIFLEMYHQLFPSRPEIGFMDWMMIGFPISVVFLISGWFILTRYIFKLPAEDFFNGKDNIKMQLKALGPIKKDEVRTLVIFGLAALLWMSGSDIKISDDFIIHGWRTWFNLPMVSDPAVAIITAVLLFIIPSGEKKGEALLSWKVTKELPWGILLLFGGGFALAGGFESSGLSKLVEIMFVNMPALPPLVMLTLVCIFVTFQTEITSNSAVTTLILPILAAGSVVYSLDPRLLMISATLSASCAFMMPIATPPQAIVYGSGYVSIRQMMKAGIWFNILGLAITIGMFSILHLFFWN
jgi:sodium-dependent dicarboxylate transporter 2/3/5